MQRWLDALHVFTLMIKKLLLRIINCYSFGRAVLKKHLKKGFAVRSFILCYMRRSKTSFTQARVSHTAMQ